MAATADTLRQHAQAEIAGAAALDAVDGLTAQVGTLTAEKATLTARVDELQKQLEQQPPAVPTPGGGAVVVARPVQAAVFETFFKGATANEKFVAMHEWSRTRTGPTQPVLFGSKAYETSVPWPIYSGQNYVADDPTPTREYSRATVLRWKGPAGSSMFRFLDQAKGEKQTGQNYPGDGSPRDIHFDAIQFEGPHGTHWMPPSGRADYKGKTLWMGDAHNCAWKGFDSVSRNAWDGFGISGISHFQDCGDDTLVVGGSECHLFTGDGYSFVDSKRMTPGSCFLRSSLSKSQIGLVMFTGRQDIVPVILDGGEATRLEGTRIDAQDSDPINGAGLQITGGSGHIISAGFKGIGAKAGAAKGWIEITGGTDHLVERSAFLRKGSSPAALTLPAVYVGGTAERIKVGLNTFPGWGGAKPIVQQTRAGRVVACTDPTVDLKTAA